jgi:hypothetical protein
MGYQATLAFFTLPSLFKKSLSSVISLKCHLFPARIIVFFLFCVLDIGEPFFFKQENFVFPFKEMFLNYCSGNFLPFDFYFSLYESSSAPF